MKVYDRLNLFVTGLLDLTENSVNVTAIIRYTNLSRGRNSKTGDLKFASLSHMEIIAYTGIVKGYFT